MQRNIQKRKPVFPCNTSKIEACFFCAGGAFIRCARGIAFLIANKKAFEPCVIGRISDDAGGVLLDGRMLFEALGEPRRRLARARKDHNSADRTVKTVNKPQVDLTGLIVFILYIPLGERQKIHIPR